MAHYLGLLFCGQEFFANVYRWDAYVDAQSRPVISVVYKGLDPCAGSHYLKTVLGRIELGKVVQVRHLDYGRVEASFLNEDT